MGNLVWPYNDFSVVKFIHHKISLNRTALFHLTQKISQQVSQVVYITVHRPHAQVSKVGRFLVCDSHLDLVCTHINATRTDN